MTRFALLLLCFTYCLRAEDAGAQGPPGEIIHMIPWNGGAEYSVLDAPAGFETLHFGTAFSFTEAVPNGEYLVTFSFIEPVVLAPGGRVFDVSINDGPVISHLDLTAKVGFMVPTTRSVIVAVTGGVMLFNFSATVRSAVVSGVTIEPLTYWI